jgi:hypothetical protein
MSDDPVLAALRQQLARLDVMKKQIDRLEGLLNQVFTRLRQIEDVQARQTAPPPAPSRPH